MRRLAELVFQDNKMKIDHEGEKCKIILNISLSKVHSQEFQEHTHTYYTLLVDKLK